MIHTVPSDVKPLNQVHHFSPPFAPFQIFSLLHEHSPPSPQVSESHRMKQATKFHQMIPSQSQGSMAYEFPTRFPTPLHLSFLVSCFSFPPLIITTVCLLINTVMTQSAAKLKKKGKPPPVVINLTSDPESDLEVTTNPAKPEKNTKRTSIKKPFTFDYEAAVAQCPNHTGQIPCDKCVFKRVEDQVVLECHCGRSVKLVSRRIQAACHHWASGRISFFDP